MLFWQAMGENRHDTHIYINYTTSDRSYLKMKTGILTTKKQVLLKLILNIENLEGINHSL